MEKEQESGARAAGLPQLRANPRFAVEQEASLHLAAHGSSHPCTVVDLSLEGCRIRTREPLPVAARVRVEVAFRVNGIAFRFSAIVQWTDASNTLGLRFAGMTSRRKDELGEVLGEVQADLAINAQKAGKAPAAGPVAVAAAPPARRERRQQERQPVDTSAVIHLINTGSRIVGRIVDLSPSGCRIRTSGPFPVGIYTRVETEFRVQGLPFRLGGVIQAIHDRARCNIGVRFLDVSDRKREQVEELIKEIADGRGN